MTRSTSNPASVLRRAPLAAGLALALGAVFSTAGAATGDGALAHDPARAGSRLATRLLDARADFARQLAAHGPHPAAPLTRPAGSLTVDNCDDSGAGSLRDAFAHAVSGDTIDLSTLSCSTITLTGGPLASSVDDLTLHGPGAAALTIDGGGNDRIVAHTGTGTLSIDGVTLANGHYVYDQPLVYGGAANGACVLSSGNVTISASHLDQCSATGVSVMGAAVHAEGALHLIDSLVTGTTATATTDEISSTIYGGVISAPAVYLDGSSVRGATVTSHTTKIFGGLLGGGVFGGVGVVMVDSTVSGIDAHVSAAQSAYAKGGGVGSGLIVVLDRSSVSDNAVHGTPGGGLYNGFTYTSAIGGGGVYIMTGAEGPPTPPSITNSTISGNTAGCEGDAPCAYTVGGGGGLATWSTQATTIGNSTISGNTSNTIGGGLYARSRGSIALVNATITDNSAPDGAGVADKAAPLGQFAIDSSLIAGNHASGSGATTELITARTIDGANNLIASSSAALPADTLGGDPRLAPLADNGGPTKTHALLPGSPAIDAGSNVANQDTDQRGDGHPRTSGKAPDIGAFEVQPSDADTIFKDGFDAAAPAIQIAR